MKKILTMLFILLISMMNSQTLTREDSILNNLNGGSNYELYEVIKIKKEDFKNKKIEERFLEKLERKWGETDEKEMIDYVKIKDPAKYMYEMKKIAEQMKKKEEYKFYDRIDSIYRQAGDKDEANKTFYESKSPRTIYDSVTKIYIANKMIKYKEEAIKRMETHENYYFIYAWYKGKDSKPLLEKLIKDPRYKDDAWTIKLALAGQHIEPYYSEMLNNYDFDEKKFSYEYGAEIKDGLDVLQYLNTQESWYQMKKILSNKKYSLAYDWGIDTWPKPTYYYYYLYNPFYLLQFKIFRDYFLKVCSDPEYEKSLLSSSFIRNITFEKTYVKCSPNYPKCFPSFCEKYGLTNGDKSKEAIEKYIQALKVEVVDPYCEIMEKFFEENKGKFELRTEEINYHPIKQYDIDVSF